MFKQALTEAEIALKLSPHKVGERYTLLRDVKTNEGLYTKGTEVEIIGVELRKDIPDTQVGFIVTRFDVPQIYKGEEDEWAAESSLFYYDLKCTDGSERKIRKAQYNAFSEGVITFPREEAKKRYKKWNTLLMLLTALLFVGSIIGGVAFGMDKAGIFIGTGTLALVPYWLHTVINDDYHSCQHLIVHKTESK